VSTIASSTSRITPFNEKVYHQSNLLGDWKGNVKKTNQAIEFKVVSINGDSALVEFTHNGHTERGTATVDKNSITFGNVTIATRNGTQAAFEFDFQPKGQLASSGTQTAVLSKDTTSAAADANPLVGGWSGATAEHGVSFTVSSVNGRDAQVKYTIDGNSGQGTGDVVKNSVLLGNAQFTNIDGLNGKVTYKSGKQTISIPVKRFVPKTA
jgi:hypothetical protein